MYPSGLKVDYYYQNGYVNEIKRDDTGKSIWKVTSVNNLDQLTGATYGNGLTTIRRYDPRGFIDTIQTGTSNNIQNLQYDFNSKGVMDWRKDARHNLIEYFGYDNINRLTTIQLGSGIIDTINYSLAGNIQKKYDVGSYSYGATQP